MLNRWNKGLVIDGRNKIAQEQSFQGLLLVAPSGFGKTSTYVVPNALMLKGKNSVVFTDPAGEIYDTTKNYLLSLNYEIKRLDMREGKQALQYNPLHRIQSTSDTQKIADTLVTTAYPKAGSDSFWNDSAKSLIGLLISFLWQQTNSSPTLNQLYQLLHQLSYNTSSLERELVLVLNSAQFQEYKSFIAQSERIVSSILSTAKTALYKLSDPEIQWLTAKESLFFESLRDKPTALFIITPEHEIEYYSAPILSLLYSQLFEFCMQLPQQNKPYLPIRFFLDEFGNMHINGFSRYVTVLRKRQISISLIIQSLSQLEFQYGKNQAQTIISGGCVNHLYYPALGLDTCQRLERIIGRKRSKYNNSLSQPLMTCDQIRTMPKNRALFITGNWRPVLVKTKAWFKNWWLKKRAR